MSSILRHIGIKKEVTWGTKENGANDFFLPFVSETLTPNIEEVLSAAQGGVIDEPKSHQGSRAFAGDIVMEVHPASLGHILRSAIGVPSGGELADATILTLEDCEDAWDEAAGVNPGVISGVDAIDKKKGSKAVKLIVTVGVDPGEILATEEIDKTDMSADTALKIWVKCNKACDPGHLQLVLDETAGCKGATHKLANIPALGVGIWEECTIALGYMSRSDIAFVYVDGIDDDTITTETGDFVAAGFIVGDEVTVTGTGSSDGKYTVTAVEAKILTVSPGVLTVSEEAGDAILNAMADYDEVISVGIKMVTDKAECTIRLDDLRQVGAYTANSARKWEFVPRQDDFPDCSLCPYTIEVHRGQVATEAFQYLGSIINILALNFGTGDKILKATMRILSKEYKRMERTPLTDMEVTQPFKWKQARIGIGAALAQNSDIESFGINQDNHCVPFYSLNKSDLARRFHRDAFRDMPVNFVIDFVDQIEHDIFIAGDEQAFQIKFEGEEIEPGFPYTLQIDIPKLRYLTYPINAGGPGRIGCAVTGKAKYDATAGVNRAIKFTLINKETAY